MSSVEQPLAVNGTHATIGVENPATGQLISTVPILEAADIELMAARARAAQPAWAALSFEERGRYFRRAQKWMFDNTQRVLDVVVSETGKTYEDATLTDLGHTAVALGFWAGHAAKYLKDERSHIWDSLFNLGKRTIVRYEPVGLVGVIGPWNYPLVNSFGDCIPALMAGNVTILKPSEVDAALLTADGRDDGGLRSARGVFSRSPPARAATGAALIDEVDLIMFTGSTRTGRKVAMAAAERLIPLHARTRRQGPDDRARRRRS